MPDQPDLKPPVVHWKGHEPYIECARCHAMRPEREMQLVGEFLVCIELGWCSTTAKDRGALEPQQEVPPPHIAEKPNDQEP